MRALGIILIVGLVACGGDDDEGGAGADAAPALACGDQGAATVNGTVGGVTVDPVATAFRVSVDFAAAIVLDEAGPACAMDSAGPGERLVLIFCDPDLVVGEYTVVREADFPEEACPGERIAAALVEVDSGDDLEDGLGGSIDVTSVGDCSTGTFEITFTDDSEATGSFAATSCE